MKNTLLVALMLLFNISYAETASSSDLRIDKEHRLTEKCDSGDGKSCLVLGQIFASGEGRDGKSDYYAAVKYYKKSCKNKYIDGCLAVSGCHETGHALPISESLQLRYLRKACNLRDEASCEKVVVIEHNRKGRL